LINHFLSSSKILKEAVATTRLTVPNVGRTQKPEAPNRRVCTGGAGGEHELVNKTVAQEEGEEALRVAEWFACREEVKRQRGGTHTGGGPKDA
tara:strand:+ start:217 stop:495 length:279 start_codon:yes stop_codon:yes gene_type:complete